MTEKLRGQFKALTLTELLSVFAGPGNLVIASDDRAWLEELKSKAVELERVQRELYEILNRQR